MTIHANILLERPAAPTPTMPQSDPPPPPVPGIDVRPASAYEAVTRQMVESLTDDIQEIKSRLNNLFFAIVGAIVIDVVARILGS